MKKIIFIFIIILTVVAFSSCGSSSGKSSDEITEKTTYYRTLSEEEAESMAVQALYEKIESHYGYRLDDSSTRYSIGSTEHNYGWTKFEIRGKYVVYDKYGDYYESGTFYARVEKSSYGNDYNSYVTLN